MVELARQLHLYGTSAARLEDAIGRVAERLGIRAEAWSSPTAIIVSFFDPDEGEDAPARSTQVMRLSPGEVNLDRLCQADRIANQVIDGQIDVDEGRRLLRILSKPHSGRGLLALSASYGLAASGIAVLFGAGWPGILVAGLIGWLIGVLTVAGYNRPRLAVAGDAISGLVATLVATLIGAFVVPLAIKPVILASLIVLVPGMSLTTAVRELSSQQLVSGTARMAGALATLLKLAFGAVTATAVCHWFGIVPMQASEVLVPQWLEWVALLVASLAIAVLFQAAYRDWLVVVLAVVVGYTISSFAGSQVGSAFGVFVGGLALGALSNLYARVFGQPGAVVREPGILLLVPGTVGFRTVSSLMEYDMTLGANTAILLASLLIALVAGLLFGDLLIPPRQSL